MAIATPELLLQGLMFPEGPRWRDGRLYFSDMYAHEVVAVDLDGTRETVVRVATQPSGLGWLPDGRMLIVSMVDRKVLRLEGEALVEHADLSDIATFHTNDMVVDAQGRAYVGNFGFDLNGGGKVCAARLACVTPDGQARVVADDLMFPNGMVITPDAKTLIVGESFGGRLTAFEIAGDGSLSQRRVWADLGTPPDGICLDDEGCVWVAVPMNPGAFLRVAEGGRIRERIALDTDGAFACMLGGPRDKTLFLLEAHTSNPAEMAPGNGRIRMVEVDVARAGRP
jgi:sugar lactone lactonase YvrE